MSRHARTPDDAAREIARVARILAAAGLVEAFGHVSARLPKGGFAITSTTPLASTRPDDVRAVHPGIQPGEGTPLEAPLHAAIYSKRADVEAICRTHSPAAVGWGARLEAPPLLHGLGMLAGGVRVCNHAELVTDERSGSSVAESLGGADCILLRANGALATGASLQQATVRAYYLEQRCRVALEAGPAGRALDDGERERRARWLVAEQPRAWSWLTQSFDPQAPAQGQRFRRQEQPDDDEEEVAHASGRT